MNGMVTCLPCRIVKATFVFFFSSRRRHTRSLRDWSSDVCSSDLFFVAPGAGPTGDDEGHAARRRPRSEERRVGKECRSRWARKHEKKKGKLRRIGWLTG